MTDWNGFAASLDGIPHELDPALVRQKSRDFFWYSPVLKQRLHGLSGDIVVMPRDEADVLAVARRCVAERIPLTVRGAGTGNYGQAVPLHGGVVLDVTGLSAIGRLADGVLSVGAGAKLIDIEAHTIPLGWELRMFPSTRRTATIGGFVAGGSGGVGSINYGQLRDRGTLLAARVVTMEAMPRVLTLRGDEVLRVHHAYGTNGIITELDIAMAPAQPWVDVAATFADFMALARFCHALTCADGVAKRLATALAASVPPYLRGLADRVPAGRHLGLFMVAAASLQPFAELLAEHGGAAIHRAPDADVPLYEYAWNHTTLQALKVDRSITYLQTLFGGDGYLEKVAAMIDRFGDEVPMHLEFVRLGGRAQAFGLQLVRFTDAARLDEIIAIHEAAGCPVFNPHTFVLEDGGMKATDPEQLAFKRLADPFGLANPGKMRGFEACLMRVLVVHAHPVPESFSGALHRAIVAALTAAGHEVDDCDLYAEGFAPVMTAAERRAYHDIGGNLSGIETHVARLHAAEALVIAAPTWWYGMPAMLKGWFDRVWAPGVAFELVPGGGAIVPRLTHIRRLAVVTTYGSPWWFMTFYMREPGRAVLTRGLRRLLAPRARLTYLAHYGMDASTDRSRSRFMARVERAMRAL